MDGELLSPVADLNLGAIIPPVQEKISEIIEGIQCSDTISSARAESAFQMNASSEFAHQELLELCSHDDERIRCAVARRSDLPDQIVWKLACDPSPRVRYRLAANKALAQFVLEALVEDEHVAVSVCAERTLKRRENRGFGNVIRRLFPAEIKEAG